MRMNISSWQLLFYISWTVLGLWLILKIAGIIKTPFWLEYGVPVASVFLGILGLYQDILKQMNKHTVGLAIVTTKLEHIDRDLELLKKTAHAH